MKRKARKFSNSIIGNVSVLLCAIALLFPSSGSVLCIAPGHVAIEDLNAVCCAQSGPGAQTEHDPCDGLKVTGSCRDCTDLLISLSERGAISKSHNDAAVRFSFRECCGERILSDACSGALLQRNPDFFAASPPSLTAPPLRC